MRDWSGMVAVVTGAGNGVGRGTALAFAGAGMHVAVSDLDGDAAEKVAGEVRAFGVKAIAQQTDVTVLEAVEHLAQRAHAELGEVRVLHNNAGVGLIDTLDKTTRADWEWLFAVNVFGVMNGLHVFLPRFLATPGRKHIVNTGSMSGHYSSAILGVYSASKFAVVAITEALRDEMADSGADIGVSLLCPGLVNTRIQGRSRRLRPKPTGTPTPAAAPTAPAATTPSPGSAPQQGEWVGARVAEPEDVGRMILDAVQNDRFWIFTHPEQRDRVKARFDEILDAMERTTL